MDHNRQPPHILLVVFPIQSHINPALQFASHLLNSGAHITIATTIAGTKRMNKSGGHPPPGLSFATISDGHDDGFIFKDSSSDDYMESLKRRGSETLSELIAAGPAADSPPFTCVAYTIILSWVAGVARRHGLPPALLWIQNATMFSIYYHYFNCDEYSEAIRNCDENDPEWTVEIPSLPPLHARDLPSFLAPSNPYRFADVSLKEQFEELARDENPIILVNTFQELESEVIESLDGKFKISAVGPLLPEGKSSAAKGFKVEMFSRPEEDYVAWLDTQADDSVVYVSFGSISVFSKKQKEEMAAALLECKRPFLWVIRKKPDSEENDDVEVTPCFQELVGTDMGMIVTWCSQVEVLSHKAVGCFVTHCGWNSTLESLTAGVPVVAVPQWTDQMTNAWMLETVWRVGVRVRVEGTAADEKVVGREELRRCVEEVMESREMREKAVMWHEKAVDAVREGGSSEVNVRAFVDEVWRMSRSKIVVNNEEL